VLYEQSAPVLVEAELLEEWLSAALDGLAGEDWDGASRERRILAPRADGRPGSRAVADGRAVAGRNR
jgi:hypothetical protein